MTEGDANPSSVYELAYNSHQPNVVTLAEIGCCSHCVLRFLGCLDCGFYLNTEALQGWYDGVKEAFDVEKIEGFGDDEKWKIEYIKLGKRACPACLGIFQLALSPDFQASICRTIEEADYEFSNFSLSFKIPIASSIRFHSIWYLLRKGSMTRFEDEPDEVAIKVVLRWIIGDIVRSKLKLEFDSDSPFQVQFEFRHTESETQGNSLISFLTRNKQQGRKKKRRKIDSAPSDAVVREGLGKCSSGSMEQHYGIPPKPCKTCVKLESQSFLHQTVLISGSYNKYDRTISHTPWFIGGQRKGTNSVQELCTNIIVERFKCPGSNFISSGREDVNVRMLGNGRPFVLELFDPHKLPWSELKELEEEVNKSTSRIQIHGLKKVDVAYSKKFKVEDKKKTYRCVVWLSKAIEEKALEVFDSISFPLRIYQKTPIRVLHRRPLLERKRNIYSFKYEYLNSHFFILELETQSGTYIKEFVHGDRGRTSPNIGSYFKCNASILQLDVVNLEFDA